jgi:hypothetical protein
VKSDEDKFYVKVIELKESNFIFVTIFKSIFKPYIQVTDNLGKVIKLDEI